MKELIGIIVGIVGFIFCIGGIFHALGAGHYVIAGFWIIGGILFISLANDALDAIDEGGPQML
ncbi:MAG: hypothetical protein NTY93_02355 [Candidatus Kaiserbacteria bacterium]|nr:hypothetical protein [Candidatus Kaiserbacteria bacterium]